MEIKLPDYAIPEIRKRIKEFVKENFDEEIGELKTHTYYDFFIREIAPFVYNQAIKDACAYFQNKVADLESDIFVPEIKSNT